MIFIVNKIMNLRREIKQSEIILSEQTKIHCPSDKELETIKQIIFNLKTQEKKSQEEYRQESDEIKKASVRISFIESEINKTRESMEKSIKELHSLKKKICYACGQNIDSLMMEKMVDKHLRDINNTTQAIGNL